MADRKTSLLILPFLFALPLLAQREQRSPAPQAPPAASPQNEHENPSGQNPRYPAPPPEEKSSKTQHVIHVNGQELRYTAIAGTLLLRDEALKPTASVFYVYYAVDNANAGTRPLTFAFNGGPGSSSVWLHMGALGPMRVALTPDGEAVPPPYHLVENQDTALAFTDLVFIDPVTTGYSRNAPGINPAEFHGLEGDLREVGEFIREFLTHYDRWASPKFLAGESYGTTRASALSQYLLSEEGIYLNGITLVSSVLNFQTIAFQSGNDLPYILFLPTYTAAAWYHKKLSGDLQSGTVEHAVDESRRFAGTTYAQALLKGDSLSPAERKQIIQDLARFTGLPPEFIDQANLRVTIFQFTKELLKSERETIGRYDSRIVGPDENVLSNNMDYDPSYANVLGAYTSAFNQYVRKDLNWQTQIPYEILTPKVQPWNYAPFTNRYVDVSPRLKAAMTQNQFMKILQANGYYDLATPFYATEYTFAHMDLSPSLRKNISLFYCGAGHMLYLKQSCLDSLHEHMAQMYRDALSSH
jgi:carboxypeptidase C (cathepsin A)